MEEALFQLLNRINSPELQAKLLGAKIPFLFATGFFIWIIVVGLTRTPYLKLSALGDAVEIATYRPFGFPKVRRRWERIMRRLDGGSETESKLAIIEADALLNEMLSRMRVSGTTIDDRLQNTTPLMLSNVEDVKGVHQIRNSIVYDPDYRLNARDARNMLLVYQKAFENLDLFR